MNKPKIKFSNLFISLCVLYLATALIINPTLCIKEGSSAIMLCINSVIPSLFPFFVCSCLFTSLGLARLCSRFLSPIMRPIFGVPGSGALAFVIGIVSGYPMGAACAVDLYKSGDCTHTEAERLISFCNNSGPLFIMGVVGCGIFKNLQVGRYLYISHIISAIISGMVFKYYGCNRIGSPSLMLPAAKNIKSTAEIIGSAFDSSVTSILKVCAYILLFSVFSAVLPGFSITPFIHALLEITGGIKSLFDASIPTEILIPLTSFFISFSGISVIFQVSSVISPCGLSIKPYIFGKLFQGIISFILTRAIINFFPITESVSSNFQVMNPSFAFSASQAFSVSLLGISLSLALVLILVIAAALVFRRQS